MDLREYVSFLCEILGIAEPKIELNALDLSGTELARCSRDGSEILIKKSKSAYDVLFAIAHELRHVWQEKYRPEMLNGYRHSAEIGADEYNLQLAELDANAFGVIVMSNLFHVAPRFESLSETVKAEIHKRADEIAEELAEE